MFEWHGYGGGVMWIFWLLVIGGLVWLVASIARGGGNAAPGEKSALDILKERYARGEIDREEYQQKRKDLQS